MDFAETNRDRHSSVEIRDAIASKNNITILQCLSNTKPLMNYLVHDDYSREINTSSSSMKGSLVKGDTKNTD